MVAHLKVEIQVEEEEEEEWQDEALEEHRQHQHHLLAGHQALAVVLSSSVINIEPFV